MIEQALRTQPHRHNSWDLWTGRPKPNLSTDSKLWCINVWKGLLGPRLTNSPSIMFYPATFFDSGTSWLGVGTSWPKVRYELTKNGYKLTKVRVDLGTSWLETYCDFVTFPLVSWVRCGILNCIDSWSLHPYLLCLNFTNVSNQTTITLARIYRVRRSDLRPSLEAHWFTLIWNWSVWFLCTV